MVWVGKLKLVVEGEVSVCDSFEIKEKLIEGRW